MNGDPCEWPVSEREVDGAGKHRVRILELLIERITFHGADGQLDITFRPTGIKTLIAEREEVTV